MIPSLSIVWGPGLLLPFVGSKYAYLYYSNDRAMMLMTEFQYDDNVVVIA